MKLSKLVIIVLSSAWFIPISCSTGIYAGIHIISFLDSRDAHRGQRLHPHSYVVAEDLSSQSTFKFARLSELDTLRALPNTSFLMKHGSGIDKTGERETVSYRIIAATDAEQIIEVEYKDDDKTIWARYKATGQNIVPVSSRMIYFGYMFQSFPFAFGFALLLYIAGRFIRNTIAHPAGSRNN